MGTVNKDTKLYFSVSSQPGNFGASLYNTAFQELGINAIYKPVKCDWNIDFVNLISAADKFNISGISVSMPFKKLAYALDGLVPSGNDIAKTVKNYNTIVLEDGDVYRGYNTDVTGFEKSCSPFLNTVKDAWIYGNGAVADSISYVLKKHNIDFGYIKKHEKISEFGAELFINASPVGMDGIPDDSFTEYCLDKFDFVFDVVVKKETKLTKIAKKFDIPCVNGVSMSLEQLCAQWTIYTGLEPPREIFKKVLKEQNYV